MSKILIIDDSSLSRNMLKKYLEEHGHKVLETYDGNMGMEYVEKYTPDCIIYDLLMPGMDGIEFLKTFRRKNIQIPVIIFSANIQDSVVNECKNLGAFEFFIKPPKFHNFPEAGNFLAVLNEALCVKKSQNILITPKQIDIFTELINIGMGRAAASLNDLLGSFINLRIPKVMVFQIDNIPEELAKFGGEPMSIVRQDFKGHFAGKVALIFSSESASSLVSAITGEREETPDIDSIRAATICEVGNILINSVLGSVCNILKQPVSFTLPEYIKMSIPPLLKEVSAKAKKEIVLMVKTLFSVEALKIEGQFLLLLDIGSFQKLIEAVNELEQKEKR